MLVSSSLSAAVVAWNRRPVSKASRSFEADAESTEAKQSWASQDINKPFFCHSPRVSGRKWTVSNAKAGPRDLDARLFDAIWLGQLHKATQEDVLRAICITYDLTWSSRKPIL